MSDDSEYLKRQVRTKSGESHHDRVAWYTLELVYGLHRKVNELAKEIEELSKVELDAE